jgi:GxxExxY protein
MDLLAQKPQYIFKEESYKIIGCAMDVHKELGNGFLEGVYQEALALELANKLIPFKQEYELPVFYKSQLLNKKYFAYFTMYCKTTNNLKYINIRLFC